LDHHREQLRLLATVSAYPADMPIPFCFDRCSPTT
jgi:hypothetical protein